MAIVQISKIQQRAGNLVDLPQLDNAEFGWASDSKQLYIGRTGNSYSDENIEVLTSYSNISFSQIQGSSGANFNIVAPTNGQILTYVSSTATWENYTGLSSQLGGSKLQLGNVSNIKIGGGATGYVLETDGVGNLSWTPKGTLYTPIVNLTNNATGNIITMRVANTTPYTNSQLVTISGGTISNSTANSNINGRSFYIKLNADYPTSGNVILYTDVGLTATANGAGLVSYTANSGIATSVIGGAGGGGTGAAGGSTTTVQFNDGGILNGNTNFTFDKITSILTLAGNANVGNLNASSSVVSSIIVSNIATGTAPLTVTSTTLVPNLYVARANVSDFGVVTTRTSGTFYPTFVSANTTSNLSLSSNANLSFNAATGALNSTLYTGTLTTNAQPNITSVGSLLSLTVLGNTTSGNFTGIFANGTSSVAIPAASGNVNISVASVANLVVITSTGINVAGTLNIGDSNANVGNIGANIGVFTGNVSAANLVGPLASGNSNITIAANANIAFTAASNTVMTISNVGVTLADYTFSTGTGNANVGNLGTSGKVIASILESNVATGTAPLTIASTTRVTNLNVAYANVADHSVMTALNTGIYYPTFISGTASANYALGSNTSFSANIANGAFVAPIISATYLRGDGSNITNLNIAAGSSIVNGTSNVSIPAANGNVNTVVAGGVVLAVTSTGANITGTANVSGNANVGNLGTLGVFANSVTLTALTGTLTVPIITTGANTTAGTITGNWSLSAESRLNATYADLAEYYESDAEYDAGTVLEFGGSKEVTIASDGTARVAGVVSTNPAYVMNSACNGIAVALALQGRVPCKVRGNISKGDMLVSGGDGYARPTNNPLMGTVIGKSLENFSGITGVIEVAVGRL